MSQESDHKQSGAADALESPLAGWSRPDSGGVLVGADGTPCPTNGKVLCTITDPDHLHTFRKPLGAVALFEQWFNGIPLGKVTSMLLSDAFLAGHTSRDAEVADLEKKKDAWKERALAEGKLVEELQGEIRELRTEVERLKEENLNHFVLQLSYEQCLHRMGHGDPERHGGHYDEIGIEYSYPTVEGLRAMAREALNHKIPATNPLATQVATLTAALEMNGKCCVCRGTGKPQCTTSLQYCPDSCACHKPHCYNCKGSGLEPWATAALSAVPAAPSSHE